MTPALWRQHAHARARRPVEPVISGTFPLGQAARAQEELSQRNHVGKIVLQL
ncbi:zinc-binding dehydrogenase [Rhodococcus sp. X156]|uniref:zinc-binding dehydrogenase n=1 Tax=Rhodococcus sp. X156 TaxID=2499145 RepID=UPI003216B762